MAKNKNNDNNWGSFVHSLASALTIVFIALRACDIIDWAWYWLLSPMFICYGAAIITLAIVAMIAIMTISKNEDI